MGNILVDEAKAALAEADLEPECPKCGSRVLIGTWVREFRLDFDTEESVETLGSGVSIASLICPCGWMQSF